jgi:hypothetical protein
MMQKREYLLLSLVMVIAVFAVMGHIPTILADGNNTNVSVNASINASSDDDGENDSGSDDDNETDVKDEDDDSDDDENETEDNDENKTKIKSGELIRKGNCTIKIEKKIEIKDGKRVEVIKKKMKCADGREAEFKMRIDNRTEDGKFRERIKYEFKGKEREVEAEDEINLEEDTNGTEYRLRAKLKNGNFTDIKIMPDQASEIALERLKALNFSIQLRERLHNNIPQVVYNIDANKSGRFLGVFKIIMKTNAQVDPETGEVLSVNAPWWAFLASQQDETVIDSGNETNSSG